MTRDKLALTSFLAAALGTLLLAGPAHATHAQHNSLAAQLQASDGNAPLMSAGERLLTHGSNAANASTDYLTSLQVSDGSAQPGPEQFWGNHGTSSKTVVADGIKTLNKVSSGYDRTFPPGFSWTDGGHAVQ